MIATRVHTHRCAEPGCDERVRCTGSPLFVDPGFVCEYDLEERMVCEDHERPRDPACEWCGLRTAGVRTWDTGDRMHSRCHAEANPGCDGAGLLWLFPMALALGLAAWHWGWLNF